MPEEHAVLLAAAQRVAGVLVARHRGHHEDAARLMADFADTEELAGGAMLLGQLSLGLYARTAGLGFEQAAQELAVQLEAAVG